MLPTHDVPCPACGEPLFSSTSLDDGINAEAAESPRIETDARGYFIQCPNCRKRVPMERVAVKDAVAYRVSPDAD
jgi:endogenous inhibitor of DNA gyrase (YacG/DUF329 family)